MSLISDLKKNVDDLYNSGLLDTDEALAFDNLMDKDKILSKIDKDIEVSKVKLGIANSLVSLSMIVS